MSYYDIHKALTQSIIDLNVGLPIAHENVDFNSSGASEFISVNTLMGDQDPITKSDLDTVTGIYQISIYTKSGTSVKTMLNATDSIMSYYIHNLKLTSNSQEIVVISTSSTSGRNDDDWFINDISVTFKSDIQRG